jgi:hypothetical protein
MEKTFKIKGKILFEPEDVTNKHVNQSSWKKIAMVLFEGDVCEYYAWFLNKRYNIQLNKPLRGPHISFINDSHRDLGDFGLKQWDIVKDKWDGKELDVILTTEPRCNESHWWLNIPEESRVQLHEIRAELGLGRPFFGLHMSLGTIHPKFLEHSNYIHSLIKNGIINFD